MIKELDKNFIKVFILLLFISCNSEINNDENEIISENPFLKISTYNDQTEVSGLEDIYIKVSNFPKIWKIYLAITNNQSIAIDSRILLNITSSFDSVFYQTVWNTSLFPNGNYDLFAEVIDSTNQRIISTKSFKVMNYDILKIINEHEAIISYQISSNEGFLFSNSINHIELEKLFNETSLKCTIERFPCGSTLSYNFSIMPDSIDKPVIAKPDSNIFFLRIQNKSIDNNFINSVTIKTSDNLEVCGDLSIQNDNQIYSLGYFNLNNKLYNEGKVEMLTTIGSNSDTTKLSFFYENKLIDTLVIN